MIFEKYDTINLSDKWFYLLFGQNGAFITTLRQWVLSRLAFCNLSGTRITVSENRVRPAVSEENSGKTTLFSDAIRFIGSEPDILEEPIVLELGEKFHGRN